MEVAVPGSDPVGSIPMEFVGWLFGGAGTGSLEILPTGGRRLYHEDGGAVAFYRDDVATETGDCILRARIKTTARGAVHLAIHTQDGTWVSSAKSRTIGQEEILAVRFQSIAEETNRLHIWLDHHAQVDVLDIECTLANFNSETPFVEPAKILPLLSEKPDYMTDKEYERFNQRFSENPIEGNAYLNRLEIKKNIEYSRSWPKIMQLSLSSYCNIMCRFCAQIKFVDTFKSPHYSPDDITVEKLEKMFGDIEMGYPYFVDFSGDGEPIVHPGFLDLLSFTRKKFPFSKLRTCTNGLALTKKMSEALVKNQLSWLNVSLNAASREGWELTTGNKNFDRVIENIRYLQDYKRQNGFTNPVVGMSYVLTRQSLEDLPRFLELCLELEIDSAAVHHMTLNYSEVMNDSVMHIKKRANEIIKQVGEDARRAGFQMALPALFTDVPDEEPPPPPVAELDFGSRRKEYMDAFAAAKGRPSKEMPGPVVDVAARPLKDTFPAIRCTYPWDYFLITGSGITRICCGGLPAEEGSILSQGFWELWNGNMRRHIRRGVNTAKIDEDCYYCPLNTTRDVNEAATHMRGGVRAEVTPV